MNARTLVLLGLAVVGPGCSWRHAGTVARGQAVATVEPADALDLQVRGLTASLETEGLKPGPLLERGFLPPGGRAAYLVKIPPAECAVIVALATASLADLDASLYTAEGVALIEDDSASARPSLTFCASTQPVEAYLTLHAYQGAGSFVAAQFTRPARADDDLHTSLGERGISALGQLARTLHERGFEDAAPRVSLPLGDARPVRMAVNVAAGECYTLAAEGGEGLTEVGIRLVDAEGGELAYGIGEPQLAALQYCANTRAELALEVVAKHGQGVARVARFRAAQAAVGGARALWLGEPSPSAAAWSSTKSKQPVAHKVAPFSRELVRLKQGEIVELAPKRGRAGCERWEAELEPGLSRATLRVEDDQGELLGEVDAQHMHACVIVCAPAKTRRITLIGRAGFGSVTVSGIHVSAPGADAREQAEPRAGERDGQLLRAQGSTGTSSACACEADDARARCSVSSGRR